VNLVKFKLAGGVWGGNRVWGEENGKTRGIGVVYVWGIPGELDSRKLTVAKLGEGLEEGTPEEK